MKRRRVPPPGLAASAVLCGAWLCLLLPGPAAAHPRQLALMPDPRGEFIRLCAPFMARRYAHPEAVCDCLRETMFDVIRDNDVLDAVLLGVTERGVPTINRAWLEPEKWSQIEPTMTAIAVPTLECMFGGGAGKRLQEELPPDGFPTMPPVQGLTP